MLAQSVFLGVNERKLQQLEAAMRNAKSYSEWRDLALRHDALSGAERWKEIPDCDMFDSAAIASRTRKLKGDMESGQADEVLFTLDEGLHGNIGGIGRRTVYAESLAGTHSIIAKYIDAVLNAIDTVADAPESQISIAEKHAFFDRAIQCYGKSALMMSGGGGLIYHHHGVVEELLAEGVLPSVICGSSAGAWVCAQLATLTDDEVSDHLSKQRYHLDLDKSILPLIATIAGFGDKSKTAAARDDLIDEFVGDMTFQEAFEETGREVSISVASADKHHRARLLNANTSPHVTLRSAARASSCVPIFSEPAILEAKDSQGKVRPYLPGQGWIDGAISSDLPMRPLARLYHVNHFIVSQINPESVIAPYLISDPKADRSGKLVSASNLFFSAMREFANIANHSNWPIRNRMTESVASAFERMELQNYSGDVTISHAFNRDSLRYMRFDFKDEDEIEALTMGGRRATWPRIDQIRNAMIIAQRLEAVKRQLEPIAG